MEIPNYFDCLQAPKAPQQAKDRRVWSIELNRVWVPTFTATNTVGKSNIPSEALGYPLRLGYDKAGAVRFSQSGRPVFKVAKEIGDNIRLMREDYEATLLNFVGKVIKNNPEGYKAQVALAQNAGEPIKQHDRRQLHLASEARAKAEAEAMAKAVAEAEAMAKAEAEAVTEGEAVKPKGRKVKELVTA